MEKNTTPMMQQWHFCKRKAGDALLLFRLGDFYEAFYEDAKIVAKELHLTLTQRQKSPMCGVPYHAADHYIDKLVAKGFKVAIAEQLEEAGQSKHLVRRDVVRIITPGTIVQSHLLSEKNNNFFASLSQIGNLFGVALIDLSTAEFRTFEMEELHELLQELLRYQPSEFLVAKKFIDKQPSFFSELSSAFPFLLNVKENCHFDLEITSKKLLSHFQVETLEGLGLRGMNGSIEAAGALLCHLSEELHLQISHIRHLQIDKISSYMALDFSCFKNLELFDSFSADKKTTLISLLDKSSTAMGGRKIRHWLQSPLLDVEEIRKRQEGIEELLQNNRILSQLPSLLDSVKDLERITMKMCCHMESPKEMIALRLSLEILPEVRRLMAPFSCTLLKEAHEQLFDLSSLTSLMQTTLVDHPPLRLSEGRVIRSGANQELDHLRSIAQDSRSWIANYQTKIRQETGIKNLKVGFTKVFGFYIEASQGQVDKVPSTFHRKQTLTSAERYTTEELKNFEHAVLSSEEKSIALEMLIYNDLREKVKARSEELYRIASGIALIDALISLARVAKEGNYVRPVVDSSHLLHIKKGRHPIIEKSLSFCKFIPNDTFMDADEHQLFLITGPNMAGKSTYIRQVALIVIMAQMGSFVPAESAHIGIVDQLFSRIGATDDIAKGQSTFMVEMSETANILHNATSRSLVLLDEVGRGTSTYDGISIAWSVAEFLLTSPKKKAKTLFATHYWELTALEGKIKGAVNYHVQVEETGSEIIFLHKIAPGKTDRSYGIHVAKLAGLPSSAIKRAEELLVFLEKQKRHQDTAPVKKDKIDEQLFLFSSASLLLQELKNILLPLDLNQLTPIEAHKKLWDLQQKVSQL